MDTTTENALNYQLATHHTIVFTVLVCLLSLFPLNIAIAEMRHHDSHVHGEGMLNIAIENKEIHIELESPAANIVGFEHSPQNHKQEEAVHLAEELLSNGNALFTFTKKAGCQLIGAKVTQNIDAEHKTETHHKEHGHEHDSHHDHDAHKDEHHAESAHSEFHATYHFECKQPEKIQVIDVTLFDLFKNFEKLDVQVLSPHGQSATSLTAQQHTINL